MFFCGRERKHLSRFFICYNKFMKISNIFLIICLIFIIVIFFISPKMLEKRIPQALPDEGIFSGTVIKEPIIKSSNIQITVSPPAGAHAPQQARKIRAPPRPGSVRRVQDAHVQPHWRWQWTWHAVRPAF